MVTSIKYQRLRGTFYLKYWLYSRSCLVCTVDGLKKKELKERMFFGVECVSTRSGSAFGVSHTATVAPVAFGKGVRFAISLPARYFARVKSVDRRYGDDGGRLLIY